MASLGEAGLGLGAGKNAAHGNAGPKPQSAARSLGLGLGLNPMQRKQARAASAAGTFGDFVGTLNPHQQKRVARLEAHQTGSKGQQRVAKNLQSGRIGGRPATGAPGAPAPGAAAAAAQPTSSGAPEGAAAAPPTGPTMDFASRQAGMFGAGNPFATRGNYSDPNNPMYAAATRDYQKGLADTRNRFASSGFGSGGREALAEGEAAGDYGARIAQIGEQAYQNDATRALQAALGGQQNLLAGNAQLGNLGNAMTGIGAGEQQLPGLGALGTLLSNFASQFTQGSQRGTSGGGMFGRKG